jgi:3-hydroxybutyryl-CoA dehydrogenase
MKIVVLAHSPLFTELQSRDVPQGWELIRAGSLQALDGHRDARLFVDLDFKADPARIEALASLLPAPVMINAVVHTLGEIGHPFIRINAWPGFLERRVDELVIPDSNAGTQIHQLYGELGWSYCKAPDIPGMISARILASIINEAYFTLEEQVSSKEEIDTAMRLGTNYPLGPFEWSEKIGLGNITDLLSVLQRTDNRYTVSGALNKAAEA